MNRDKVLRVLSLTEEFAERVADVENDWPLVVGTKASGALRRTSMELTRALADLRRPG